MTSSPRNARGRRTRDALLTATRAILEDGGGFEALTMAAVADRAGVSRRAVYLHFASRGELVTALFDFLADAEGLASSLRPVWDAPDAVAALREWVRHLVSYHPRLIAVDRAIERVRDSDPDAASHRRLVTRGQLASCRRIAARLADEGRLAPPWTVETATDMLWSLISTDMIDKLLADRRWSRARLEKHLIALHHATFVREVSSRDTTR
jgi:AcrR family transcriptional regulator